MAANLLAHAGDLFACGIARSGAFNRTLTPFGFQAEERSYWEVGRGWGARVRARVGLGLSWGGAQVAIECTEQAGAKQE